MSAVERTIDLRTGVALETVLLSPKNSLPSTEPANAEATLGVSRLAVFCHPWSWLGGRKEDPVLHQLVRPFQERGYHVALFNSRGVGQSTKWPSFSALSEAEDLQCLVETLVEELGKNNKLERVVLLGYSHGSVSVSHHPPLTMPFHQPPVKTSHILLSYPLSPLPLLTMFHHGRHADALRSLISDPDSDVLILYGTRDQFTAENKYNAWVHELQLMAGEKNLEVRKIQGADHFWGGSHMRTLLETVSNWVDRA